MARTTLPSLAITARLHAARELSRPCDLELPRLPLESLFATSRSTAIARRSKSHCRSRPPTRTFASVFPNNGILIEDTDGVSIDHVDFTNITNFAALISHSKNVAIDHVSVKDSGSRNAKGRNNTSGGILLEEGTEQFTVADSTFRNIRGNGVWTHSRYMAPRNRNGKILRNEFSEIGRDAIQVGHAVAVEVAGNHGSAHRVSSRI